ncbi:enoyl-[acyl-carrier-protein] reductase FabK [Hydrogeniiclostridium mannosilyticum]|uniref:Probable nitronate monooxygenase n=1 Tax=Hydrogeniiclostridium mannosilyticum TaxID=2764322 RepID=A0A328UJJ5_9FIRM|nr:enoyl-[acyl-carrier-protein] reductase FabK [Hydrogeniiclostridium mannosilyticum]RAQ29185.1 enoyl-[acyl-carrier-protein] reductase FabK [Hydrogeniiclostridium mannosilyticum]
MVHTPICELLGIRYPIIQGGMAWIADADLAAAVSNGGGLGLISAMNANADWLRDQIRKAKALTKEPFGVNIMLMSPFAEEVARVVVEEQVPVVTTGAGSPGKYMEAWRAAGIKVLPVVASVALARMMERSGATAIIAEGGESGGHVGETTTMALIPQVCDAVQLPVVAAGGIGDGRGMAAALMLGASGVQMGTRFLVAQECNVHENYKKKILKAKDIDTIVTGRRLGHPVRSLKNRFSRDYYQREYDSSFTDENLEEMGVGSLRRAAIEGDEQRGSFLAGQIAGLVNREQSAAEILHEVDALAAELLKGASQWIK